MIIDYMPDELMLVSGAMNPLVMTGTMAEAQVNGRWDELDYLLIKNNRSYSHGFTEGFWDFTLGNLEGLVTKPLNDWDRMSTYVGDVFSGRNTDNWLITGMKLVSMPMQCVSGIPIYDSLDRMDEDIEKAKSVFRVGRQIMQMSPAEKAELALSAGVALPWTGRAVYNHYNAVFHSEEGVAQLFYKGGYGVGAVTGIVADAIVSEAVAKELMQIGGKKNITSLSELMSPEDAERYLRFQDNGSSAGLRAEELAGIQKVDDQMALGRVDYDEVLAGRNRGSNGSVLLDDVTGSGTVISKPNQVHHYATNKNGTYTPQFEEIANKYGLDLDDAWNKGLLPHQGRHPNAYHDYVLDSMKQFDEIAQGDQEVFLELFESMKKNIQANPDMLYKDYWN